MIKLTFLDSSRQDLWNDILFIWFLRRLHISIGSGNDIISCHMVFKFAYFVEPKSVSLQSFNAVNCLDQVLQRDYQNTMMTSL